MFKNKNSYKPIIENKTNRHYKFIKKYFSNIYLNSDKFIKRNDLFIICIRDWKYKIISVAIIKEEKLSEWVLKDKPLLTKTETLFISGKKLVFKNIDYKSLKIYRIKNLKYISNLKLVKFKSYRVLFTLVNKNYRGKGFNQLILNYLWDYSLDKNIRYLVANIRESNKSSINSFLKNGFTISKRVQKPYKNGEKKIRVTRYL